MLRTLALTILLTFTANSAFALTPKEIVTKGKILAEGANDDGIQMLILHSGKLYQCDATGMFLTCYEVDRERMG